MAVVGAPTLQSTKHKHKKKLSHTHTQHTHDEPRPTLPRAALPSLSPWVGQRCHQIMAPPLPIAMRRRRSIGVALAVVGLLFLGGLVTKIELERGGGRHGLRWPPIDGKTQQSNERWLRRWGIRWGGDSNGRNAWVMVFTCRSVAELNGRN